MSYRFPEETWIPGAEGSWVDANGSRNISLKLTVKLPSNKLSCRVSRRKLSSYRQLSQIKFGANFAALLNDPTSADIKIVTRDDKNLFAHKLILNGNKYSKLNIK